MGLSRLSEKCQKCNHKDTCDNKRMEACAYIVPQMSNMASGGIVNSNNLFIPNRDDYEIVGNFKPIGNYKPMNDELISSIRHGIEKALRDGGLKVNCRV